MKQKRIPEAVLPGFKVIAGLNHKQVVAIAHLMEDIPEGDSGEKFYEALAGTKLLNERDAINLARTVISFGSLLFYNEKSVEELATDMSESYVKGTGEEDLKEQLLKNLKILFNSSGNILKTFKAFDLLSDEQRIFTKARVLTDIRPLVDDKVDNLQEAAILHRLKIEYIENGKEKDFFVSLNLQDIEELERVLARGKKKELKLKEDINDFHFIDLK